MPKVKSVAVWQCGSRFYKLTRAHTRICFRKQPPHCHTATHPPSPHSPTATHPPPHNSVLIFVILCLALSDLSEEQVHGIHSAFMLSNVILCNSFFAPLLTGNLSPKKCTLFGGGLVYGRPATDPRETREKHTTFLQRDDGGGILKIVRLLR